MKKTFLRVIWLAVAAVLILSCVSGCQTVTKKYSVNDVDLTGEYKTPADYISELEAMAPDHTDPGSDDPGTDPGTNPGSDDPGTDPGTNPGSDNPGSNDPGTDPGSDDPGSDDPQPEKDYSDYLTIATYNVQGFQKGDEKEYNGIAAEIKEIDADIIGLQEVFKMKPDYDNRDQVAYLAEKAGYPYYYFGSAKDDMYGHAIMSKYPFKGNPTTTLFNAQDGEVRSYDRAVIDVDGTELVFYCTHLCLDDTFQTQAQQVGEVIKQMNKDKYPILVGDFNCTAEYLQDVINIKKYMPLNGGEFFTFYINTHPEGNSSNRPIDNIIVSTNFDYYMNDDTNVGLMVSRTEWSDHNMAYTYVKFK